MFDFEGAAFFAPPGRNADFIADIASFNRIEVIVLAANGITVDCDDDVGESSFKEEDEEESRKTTDNDESEEEEETVSEEVSVIVQSFYVLAAKRNSHSQEEFNQQRTTNIPSMATTFPDVSSDAT